MKRTFARQLIIFAREGERLHRWRMILTALSCVVVSLTTYAMILPGMTLEGDYQCGLTEHTHTASCYEIGQNGDKHLVCTLEEHVHDEHCLAPQKEEKPVLLCGIPYEHTHTEACWQNGVLVCTLKEHVHTDVCYPTVVERIETKLTRTAAPPSTVGTAGEGFFDEEATYLRLSDDSVRFSITKNGEPVDKSLAHGGGYAFKLNVDTYLRHYGDEKRVYWTRLSERNFTLYAVTSAGELIALEDYAGVWTTLKKSDGTDSYADMLIRKDTDGYYWFFFRSMLGTTDYIMVSGSADSNRKMSSMGLTKTGEWNDAALAYRYTINASIPHVYNAYDQSYYVTDIMILPGTGVEYDAFTRNKDSISVTRQSDGKTIPRIDAATSGDELAWELDGNGKLWLLNRTVHSGSHLAPGPTGHDGWCACWGVSTDTELKITFLDTSAQQYYGKYTNSSFYNCAYLTAANGNQLQATAQKTIPNDMVSKTFNARSNTFTLVLNRGKYDLSFLDPYTVDDTMSGAKLIASSLQVVKKENSADNGTVLTAGTDYTLDDKGYGFRLSIKNPGSNIFVVTYRVQPDSAGETIHNDVVINGTAIAASAGGSDRKAKYTESTDNWQFIVKLTKRYEGGNPEKGARFGVYEAATDKLCAVSETVSGGGGTYRTLYEIDGEAKKLVRSEAYTKGAASDTVLFDSDAGLYPLKVYYIQEIETPAGYSLSSKKHYFYVTSASTGGTPADLGKYTGAAQPKAITEWTTAVSGGKTINFVEYGFADIVYNALSIHELPSTGGRGTKYIYLAGAVLFLAPLIVLTRRGGGSDKKAKNVKKGWENK